MKQCVEAERRCLFWIAISSKNVKMPFHIRFVVSFAFVEFKIFLRSHLSTQIDALHEKVDRLEQYLRYVLYYPNVIEFDECKPRHLE